MDETCDPRAAADYLRSLAHPMRLRILCRLLEGELPVSGFESELGLKQPNLSQQLGQLREAGLVSTRRQAKSVYYRLADRRVEYVLDAVRNALTGAAPFVAPEPGRSAASPKGAATECGAFPVVGWPDGTKDPTHD